MSRCVVWRSEPVDDVGNVSQGVWSGVNLSLCAVNLGNVAGHTLSTDKLAEMYALMAMTIHLYLPTPFHFLVVSFLLQLQAFHGCLILHTSHAGKAVLESRVVLCATLHRNWLNYFLSRSGRRFCGQTYMLIDTGRYIVTHCWLVQCQQLNVV